MDPAHSWHSRQPMPPPPSFTPPPPAGSICPVCAIPHFPFCPPPFSQTPRMPFHDQFYPHAPPPPMQPQLPPPQVPYDPFLDPQTQNNRNPYLGRDLHGYSNPDFDYAHTGAKRMRVDEPVHRRSIGQNLEDSHRVLSDDERRLKLIREHGGLNHAPNNQFDGSVGGRIGFEGKSLSAPGARSFHDASFSNFEKKDAVYSQDLHFKLRKSGEDSLEAQNIHSGRDVDPGRLKYAHGNLYRYGGGNLSNGYSKPEVNGQNSEGRRYNLSGAVVFGGDSQSLLGGIAGYNDSSNHFCTGNHEPSNPYLQPYQMQHGMELKHSHYGVRYGNRQGGDVDRGPSQPSHLFNGQPPLPASPPPPLPVEPPGGRFPEPVASTSPSSLFPISVASSAPRASLYPSIPEAKSLPATCFPSTSHLNASSGFLFEGQQTIQHASTKTYLRETERFPLQHISSEKPKVIDASQLFKHPGRASRPDHFVIILRGLPGSGKSYLAKMLRDLEVENGGNAPRIHTMDDYFMTEVEKVEESEGLKPSGSVRVKRPVTKTVIEYCYEPEMEEAYRSSMLKAFKKTLDEGVFSFVIAFRV